MQLTVQGLLVAGLVLVPGFANRYVRRRVSTAELEEESSELELTLTSLAYALLLLGLEALALFVVSRAWAGLRNEMGLLIADGLEAYADRRPNALAAGIFTLALANTVIMAAAGAYDIPDRILQPRLRTLGVSESSLWFRQLEEQVRTLERIDSREAFAHVRVHLKDGTVYTGIYTGMSTRPDRCGNRGLAISAACYYSKGGERQELPDLGDGNAVILSSDQICAIEICYQTRPASAETRRT